MRKITEDEVLCEKTDEDPMLIATTSTALTQANVSNITMLNETVAKEVLALWS